MRHAGLAVATALILATGCGGTGHGDPVLVRIPPGSSFRSVTDSLVAHDVIRLPIGFRLYARLTGVASRVKAGTYGFRRHSGWRAVLDDLTAGHVLTTRLVIPEGWDLAAIAPRLAAVTHRAEDSVRAVLDDPASAQRFGVPGPTLEGYLYPATYTLPLEAPLDTVIGRLVTSYREAWTPARQAAADSLHLSPRQVVTLASIIEKEAKRPEEMPIISAVFHNRLRIGYPLQADPTVQYALGQHHNRLLYAQIDSVAANPYNTYTHAGLPPGPIGSPSGRALDAALHPAPVDYLYFVARPDGSHVFTRTLEEHNRARAAVRRERNTRAHDTSNAAGTARSH